MSQINITKTVADLTRLCCLESERVLDLTEALTSINVDLNFIGIENYLFEVDVEAQQEMIDEIENSLSNHLHTEIYQEDLMIADKKYQLFGQEVFLLKIKNKCYSMQVDCLSIIYRLYLK